MDETAALDLSKTMAVMSSQMDGMRTDIGEIKQDVRRLSDEAPIHRISDLEKWREDVKDKVGAIPELTRWKHNVGRFLAALAVGLIVALSGTVFAIILAR